MTADRVVDRALADLYREHYRSLVRLAALLVRNVTTAEKVVQDSFVAMHGRWRRLGDTDGALSYLRESVVNRSRSELRAAAPPLAVPGADRGAIGWPERSAVVAALGALPMLQREALVLHYYGNLSETQIAAAMGVSMGAVKIHMTRAIDALDSVLQSAW